MFSSKHFHISVFIVVFILSFGLSSFEKHEEYYSLTNIKYKENKKTLEITMRFFIDDFEKALNKSFEKDFELATKKELSSTDKYILQYLILHFQLKADDVDLQYHWIGKEYEKDSIYIYLEVTEVAPFSSFYIKHNSIYDIYPIQENIVKLIAFNQYKTAVLTSKNTSKTYSFK